MHGTADSSYGDSIRSRSPANDAPRGQHAITDTRKARRDAEKAARDALRGALVGAAGELGAAFPSVRAAEIQVSVAQDRAETIVIAARKEADNLVAKAQANAVGAREEYRGAWLAAKAAGWSPA